MPASRRENESETMSFTVDEQRAYVHAWLDVYLLLRRNPALWELRQRMDGYLYRDNLTRP
jgi:hypothetical protein